MPLWLAIAVAVLAAWAFYEHLLIPALRWMVTRPANQVIDDISHRLRIGIRPFQRTRRQALVHRLLTDPKVQQAAEQYAARHRTPLPAVLKKVERYAREIVPAFNAYLYFRIGYWLGRAIARTLYRVRLGYIDAAGIARIDPDATVVLVMNHRSNMDYVLAGFMAADQAALSYAVGEWARIWPLSALIRAMGAYFVRRDSGDELYRRVLERYIVMATEAGVPPTLAYNPGGLGPKDAFVLRHVLIPGDPPPCQRLNDGTGVYVVLGYAYIPFAAYTFICPARHPLFYRRASPPRA